MKKLLKWMLILAGAAVGLVVLAVVGLVIAGHRAGAGHNETSIEINRPPAQVWTHFTRIEKLKAWIPYMTEIRLESGDEVKTGSVLHMKAVMGDEVTRADEQVLSFEPARRLELKISTLPGDPQGFDERAVFTLEDLGGGRTRVHGTADSRYFGAMVELLEPIITRSAQQSMEADFARLKANVEAEPVAQR